ncbi:glycosyltransferase [Paenibacillus sp. UNC499MF]|uniref:glycosyltransferase n=1 Tax=Paenibacillus sp. UNC499MF TaxID=1502751 RepID=UPI00089FD194|nr:glycosyltransferase [Paenibacillus sp. UNC499MF]SEG61751.1 Glycosyltransferase involved in cell wall bisynthesis [Paenibacillus sp. UNC499MF]
MLQKLRSDLQYKRMQDVKAETCPKRPLQAKQMSPKHRLHIVFVMNQVGIWGGVKIVFEQANRLMEKGFRITIISRHPFPEWFPLQAEYIQLPYALDLGQGIPLCDLIVATYYDHIFECVQTGIAPVVYFEQGDKHLFEPEKLEEEQSLFIQKQLNYADRILTVSNQAHNLLRDLYHCDSTVIHNGIDSHTFNPEGSVPDRKRPYLLMMGNEQIAFKGIHDVWEAYLKSAAIKEHYDLIWITPVEPQFSIKDKAWITEVHVNPTQQEIAELYRGASVFVSGSHYESFSLPVIEAMASGCPVVSTRNRGVLEYAAEGSNILLAEIGDPESLSKQLTYLLENPLLREKQIVKGLETAARFSWNAVLPQIENYYKESAGCDPVPVNSLDEWDILIQEKDFVNEEEFGRFIKRLLHSSKDKIELVSVYSLIENHSFGRWETAAVRKQPGNRMSVDRAYILARSAISPESDHDTAIGVLAQGMPEEAYRLWQRLINTNHASPDQQGIYTKWLILCLIELERDDDALQILNRTLPKHPDYTDLYYLYALVLTLLGKGSEAGPVIGLAKLVGDAAHYPEFFLNSSALLKNLQQ